MVSTHAPLAGSDLTIRLGADTTELFQPTLPLRGATQQIGGLGRQHRVSTHAPLAGSDQCRCLLLLVGVVSTHAPLAGSDLIAFCSPSFCACSFNPRSPCGERPFQFSNASWAQQFQPTLPLRGATYNAGAGDDTLAVSTHAPLAGSDLGEPGRGQEVRVFQPTLPLRGATHVSVLGIVCGDVSTHAPLAGSDSRAPRTAAPSRGFNPRSPCGERRRGHPVEPRQARFNPRSPCGERHLLDGALERPQLFQPTLPLRGATFDQRCSTLNPIRFNPRSPCGERRSNSFAAPMRHLFQPTLPLRGATANSVS